MNKKVFTNNAMEIMGLFTKDINTSYYGRDVARKLKSNQRTIQLALNVLEKEKILVSEVKGKLKEFSLNKTNILTKNILIELVFLLPSIAFTRKDFLRPQDGNRLHASAYHRWGSSTCKSSGFTGNPRLTALSQW